MSSKCQSSKLCQCYVNVNMSKLKPKLLPTELILMGLYTNSPMELYVGFYGTFIQFFTIFFQINFIFNGQKTTKNT